MTIGYTTAAAFGEEKDLWYTWFGVVTLILTRLVLFLLASPVGGSMAVAGENVTCSLDACHFAYREWLAAF